MDDYEGWGYIWIFVINFINWNILKSYFLNFFFGFVIKLEYGKKNRYCVDIFRWKWGKWVILVIRFLYIFYFVSCDIILLLIVESVFEVVNVNLGCVLVCWNV